MNESIELLIQELYVNASSPYNDGWVASSHKKELYMLRHKIDKLLSKCPSFGSLEDEWEKEIVFNILKEK